MRKRKSLLSIIDAISEQTGKVASFLIICIVLVLVYEVVMRYVLNQPTIWVHELTQFLFGPYFLFAGAYCLLYKAHVSVDIVYTRFPARMKAIMDLVTSILFFLACVVLVWKGWDMAWTSLSNLETSATTWDPPVYPLKMIIPLSAFLLLLQGLAKFIRDLQSAIKGAN